MNRGDLLIFCSTVGIELFLNDRQLPAPLKYASPVVRSPAAVSARRLSSLNRAC